MFLVCSRVGGYLASPGIGWEIMSFTLGDGGIVLLLYT